MKFRRLPFILPALLFILIAGCRKNNEDNSSTNHYQYNLGPIIYSPYIKDSLNGVLQEFSYTYEKTAGGYSDSLKSFHIYRFEQNQTNSWTIDGTDIQLTQISYPTTYYGGTHVSMYYVSNNNTFYYMIIDTTLFSVTLTSFSNDTLTGNFSGRLISNNAPNDSIRDFSYGEFSIYLKSN